DAGSLQPSTVCYGLSQQNHRHHGARTPNTNPRKYQMSAPADAVVMRPPRKVVFLGFDGVLVNRESLRTASGFRSKGSSDCVAALNRITDKTGAVIVVSSTWRRKGRGFVLRTLRAWGVTGRMIGITPVLNAVDRGEEIQAWL